MRKQIGFAGIEAIESTRPDQRLGAAGSHVLGRDPFEEIVQALERAASDSRALTIASTALNPTPLIAPSPKWIFPSLATRKSTCPSLIFGSSTSIPIRRQSSICSTKNLSRSAPSISEESTAAMNSRRIVGLQISGLKGDQGVGRAMRLVEAVAAEVHDQLEDLGGLVAVQTLGDALP